MLLQVPLMLLGAWIMTEPCFYVAVGTRANVGGASSASIVPSVSDPWLASVGVLMAVLRSALASFGG